VKKQMVYWLTFVSPGSFVANESSVMVGALPDPQDVSFPESAYAFTMHRREDVIDGDKEYRGKAEQVGPTYYHSDSKIETLAEVRKNPRASRILVSNMECNRWPSIIWTRWGNWPQPYEPGKATILPKVSA
jgi:hypothetical protein